VGWSLRQKEMLGIVLDAIQSLRSSARSPLPSILPDERRIEAAFDLFRLSQ
jgi:hypothetical protein